MGNFTNYFEKNFKFLLLLFFYITIIISFYLGEDSTGGAFLDYQNQSKVINEFLKDFTYAFLNYDQLPYTTRHSPVLLILISFLKKLQLNDEIIRLIYLHLNLLLPLYFFKSLEIKLKNIDKNYLLLLTCIIFLSPTFRSLSVWPDSRIFGLTLFAISVFYFLKFINEKSLKYVFLNVLFCALSAYVSPNFAIFAFFFSFVFIRHYGLFSYKWISILIMNLLLALPAIYYVFFLKIYFFYAKATVDLSGEDVLFFNFYNQILITSSIIFFYLIPFLITNIIKINIKENRLIIFVISIFITLICINFFNYEINFTGGGIIFQASNYLFGNNLFFYLFSFISIFTILILLFRNYENLILIICVFLSNPQTTIYHKYYDLLIMILILTIFFIEINFKAFTKKNFLVLYAYFLIFLVINNFKYLL